MQAELLQRTEAAEAPVFLDDLLQLLQRSAGHADSTPRLTEEYKSTLSGMTARSPRPELPEFTRGAGLPRMRWMCYCGYRMGEANWSVPTPEGWQRLAGG